MDGNGQYPRTYLEVSMLPNGAHAEARPWAHGAGNLWNNQRLLCTLAPAPRRSRARRRRTQQTRADVGPVWCEAQLCDTCWCRPRAIVLLDFLSPTHGEYKRTKHACMHRTGSKTSHKIEMVVSISYAPMPARRGRQPRPHGKNDHFQVGSPT